MVFTDPPYGVSYKGTNNPNGRDWDIIKGDKLRGNELYQLILKAFKNIMPYLDDKAALYIFHASKNQIIFEEALNEAGITIKQQLIWNKHHILGHSDYHYNHEPLFYANKTGHQPLFHGDRINKTILETPDVIKDYTEKQAKALLQKIIKNSTMWTNKKDNAKDYVHPTQKPTSLAEKAIINSSKPGQTIMDMFGGSGSTLLACHYTNRKAIIIEYDETFCSHIIERYETNTNTKHIKLA